MAHTKFGVNMSKLCRDTASDTVWHYASTFVALFKNRFVYGHKQFLSAQSEDYLTRIW